MVVGQVEEMVKEGCFLIGAALLRIATTSSLAGWAEEQRRPDEVNAFLAHASLDISNALAGQYITTDDAEEMRRCIEKHEKATNGHEKQDALAELCVIAYGVTFDKVVECECK